MKRFLALLSALALLLAPALASAQSMQFSTGGSGASLPTGTSGHVVPYLDGANTFSATQTVGSPFIINTNQAFPGAASGNGIFYHSAANGLVVYGEGSTNDFLLLSKSGSSVMEVATGGQGVLFYGTVTANGAISASNLSGTNTGNQTITLTSDVTGTGTGSFATTIANGAVTLAKQANFAASSLQGNPTGSSAAPSAITLAGGLGFSGTTLTAAGALTPTSVASTGAVTSSGATSGIGYATGAGGAVTQATSRTTTVVNNKACGAITMFSAAGSATWATFTVTDSAVAATDTIIANEKSGTNLYMLAITSIGSGTFNLSFATTGGTAVDAPVINYCVIKGVAA